MTPHTNPDLDALAQRLAAQDAAVARLNRPALPAADDLANLIDSLRRLVFPGFFDRPAVDEAELATRLAGELRRARGLAERALAAAYRCCDESDCARCGDEAAAVLFAALPDLRERLALDVRAAYEGDPAAQSIDEIVACYPGVDAVFAYRVARVLYEHAVPLAPRMICEQAHARTGIDIHPGARIGRRFFIDHGAGVVIGETCEIGSDVKLYQGVTLGAKSFPTDADGKLIRGAKRHPTLGDRVTVYAGAVVLGGDTTIGDDCVISGGVCVTESVPPGRLVRQKHPELILREARQDASRT